MVNSKLKATIFKQVWLPHMVWVKSRKWVKVKGKASVYDGNNAYWDKRCLDYGSWNDREKKLLRRQEGFCPVCLAKITVDDPCETDHVIPRSLGGKDNIDNLQLVHKSCHKAKTRSDGSLKRG